MNTLYKWKGCVKDYQGLLLKAEGVNVVKNENNLVSCITFSNLDTNRQIYEQLNCN